jgi:hypothetical protein
VTTPDPIGSALALLFLGFPSGVTDDPKTLYYGELKRLNVAPVDALEAAQRILHTRESRSVPPLAEVLRRVAEARADRLKRDDDDPTRGMRKLTKADAEHMRNSRELAEYGVYWCGDERNYVPMCGHGVECNDRHPDSLDLSREALDYVRREGWQKLPNREPKPGTVGDILSQARIFD